MQKLASLTYYNFQLRECLFRRTFDQVRSDGLNFLRWNCQYFGAIASLDLVQCLLCVAKGTRCDAICTNA